MRRHVAYDGHHATGYLAIQLVVGRERLYAHIWEQLTQLIERRTSLHAQVLSLSAARHHASIVVRKHDNGFPLQIWTENTLATHVAVVAIADGIPLHRLHCFIVHTTTPHTEVVVGVDAYRQIVSVGGSQLDVALLLVLQVEILDGKLAVDERHDDVAVDGLQRAVDHRDVAVADTRLNHRVARHTPVERSLRILYKVAVEVETIVQIVVRRTREARLYRRCKCKREPMCEVALQKFYLSSLIIIHSQIHFIFAKVAIFYKFS